MDRQNISFWWLVTNADGKCSRPRDELNHLHKLSKYFLFKARITSAVCSIRALGDSPPKTEIKFYISYSQYYWSVNKRFTYTTKKLRYQNQPLILNDDHQLGWFSAGVNKVHQKMCSSFKRLWFRPGQSYDSTIEERCNRIGGAIQEIRILSYNLSEETQKRSQNIVVFC